MSKEEQSIELVNPEISKIKVGARIGLFLISFCLLLLGFSFSQSTQPVEMILKLCSYILAGVGGGLIGKGLGGQKYKSQWITKRD
ncbi:MAG: hypothetical protein ACW991_04355 [Candidatus Hodarchaeales archaeon]